MAKPARSRLPIAARAKSGTYSVRIFQAPRINQRTLARMLQASEGELPAHLKPKLLKTIQVNARSLHLARAAIEAKITELGLQVRSVNRGHRDFIVYVTHPEDVNVPPNP